MVNTGKPSSGCGECRRRRVKCDEARPECQRCRNLNISCPGYVREFRFKSFQASRRKGRQSASPSECPTCNSANAVMVRNGGPSSSFCATCSKPSKTRANAGPLELITVDVPLQDRSVSLFLSSFTYCTDLNRGETFFLDFVQDMYRDGGQESSIAYTVTAVAHLNFMNRHKTGNLAGWVTSSYARALAKTNTVLSKPATAYTDSTLASVYLLSMFELLVPDEDPHRQLHTNAWSEHNNGAMALLVSRGIDQLKTPQGVQLFRLVHTTTLIGMMLDGKRPPEQLLEMITTVLKSPPKHRNEELLLSKQLHLLTDMMALRKGPSRGVLDAQKAFRQAAFENDAWRPRSVTSPHARKQRWPEQYYFTSGFVLSNWVSHWACAILLYQSALDQQPDFEFDDASFADRVQLLAEVEENARRILQSVSFAFGEIDSEGNRKCSISPEDTIHAGSAIGPTHLLWPLGVILACPYVSHLQKVFAYDALRCIGHVFKVTRALSLVS